MFDKKSYEDFLNEISKNPDLSSLLSFKRESYPEQARSTGLGWASLGN